MESFETFKIFHADIYIYDKTFLKREKEIGCVEVYLGQFIPRILFLSETVKAR